MEDGLLIGAHPPGEDFDDASFLGELLLPGELLRGAADDDEGEGFRGFDNGQEAPGVIFYRFLILVERVKEEYGVALVSDRVDERVSILVAERDELQVEVRTPQAAEMAEGVV